MKTINLSGAVGYEISDLLVSSLLTKYAGEPVEILISSPGGSVFEAAAIISSIQKHGNVKTIIKGLAGSAAASIWLSGNTRAVYPQSVFFQHRSWAVVVGGAPLLISRGKLLSDIDDLEANNLSKLMGKSPEDILKLLDDELWIVGGQSILDAGLATELIESSDDEKEIDTSATKQDAAAKVYAILERMKTDAEARGNDQMFNQVAASLGRLAAPRDNPNMPVNVQNAISAEREKAIQIMSLYGCPAHVVKEFENGFDITALQISEVTRANLKRMETAKKDAETISYGLSAPAQLPSDTAVDNQVSAWEKIYDRAVDEYAERKYGTKGRK